MKITSKLLPENIRKCMPKEDRKHLRIQTEQEISDRASRGEELELHKQVESWCRRNGVIYVHSRTDKKSTIAPGHPDFTLLRNGKGCLLELKSEHGSLTKEQIELLPEISNAEVPYLCTASYAQAVRFAIENLDMRESEVI